MQTHWKPSVLLPLAIIAAAAARNDLRARREKLFAAYQRKPVRCGFLWLKTRPATAAEGKMRAAANSWDYAWLEISCTREAIDMLQRIVGACENPAADVIVLNDNETKILKLYSKG